MLTTNHKTVKTALKALKLDESAMINGRLCIRKRVKRDRVGANEWDVDAQRMSLDEAMEELLPGKGQCLLKGDL